jgi:hypothetical protein
MPVTGTGTIEYQDRMFNVRWVGSSNISWIAWPAASNGEPLMLVRFVNEGVYGYIGVSRQRAVACANAKSTGEYLNRIIKPQYEVVKLASDWAS